MLVAYQFPASAKGDCNSAAHAWSFCRVTIKSLIDWCHALACKRSAYASRTASTVQCRRRSNLGLSLLLQILSCFRYCCKVVLSCLLTRPGRLRVTCVANATFFFIQIVPDQARSAHVSLNTVVSTTVHYPSHSCDTLSILKSTLSTYRSMFFCLQPSLGGKLSYK